MMTQNRCLLIAVVVQLLALPLGPLAAKPIININDALKSAKPGDTVHIPRADYGLIEIHQHNFEPPVTLSFDPKATITKMRIHGASGLHFKNLNILAGIATDPVRENAVFVSGGRNIQFSNGQFAWSKDNDPLNDGTALVIDGTTDVVVTESNFSHAREALIIRSSKNVKIEKSVFTDLLEDAIVIAGSTDVIIDNNFCKNFRSDAFPEGHPDCVQLQAGGRAIPNHNVTISNNKIIQGNGDKAQSIIVSSRHLDKPHTKILIENNISRQSTGLAIQTYNAHDVIIRGNRVFPSAKATEAPRILVRTPGRNAVLENNIAARVKGPDDAIIRNNKRPEQ